MTAAQIIHTDDKKTVGIDRLTGTHHVVPPADALLIFRIHTGDVVTAGKRMANQDRIGPRSIQLAVGLVHQVIAFQRQSAFQLQWLVDLHVLRCYHTD